MARSYRSCVEKAGPGTRVLNGQGRKVKGDQAGSVYVPESLGSCLALGLDGGQENLVSEYYPSHAVPRRHNQGRGRLVDLLR